MYKSNQNSTNKGKGAKANEKVIDPIRQVSIVRSNVRWAMETFNEHYDYDRGITSNLW